MSNQGNWNGNWNGNWRESPENYDIPYEPRRKSINSGPSNDDNHNDYKPPEYYYKLCKNDNELLYYASKFDDSELIFTLDITNPNLNQYDDDYNRYMCPLLYSIFNDNTHIFNFLLSFKNIDVNFFIDDEMNPLIHELLQFNHLKYIKLHPNLDLNIENNRGETAVYIAVKYFGHNPKEYLSIIQTMIDTDESITRKFNQKSILDYAFHLSPSKERDELFMLLYKYETSFPEGPQKNKILKLIRDKRQFKDARHFTALVSKHPKLSRRTKHEILEYLTHKPRIRLKNTIYNNAATLRIASKSSNPFKITDVHMDEIKSYLSKTTKKNILAGKPSSKKRVHIHKKRVHSRKKK